MHNIKFFQSDNGKEPVREFLDSLDTKMKAKALREITLLRDNGQELREPHCKYIDKGIFELRIKFSSNISRIYYFFYVNNNIILTHGFIKKTQKTPPREIEKAIKYKMAFERRHSND
ncbi:type II toxin-antitoxin system RelE/ParE family toxin [Vallitalea sediminicola]